MSLFVQRSDPHPVLILGLEHAGKTSLLNYCYDKQQQPQHSPRSTPRKELVQHAHSTTGCKIEMALFESDGDFSDKVPFPAVNAIIVLVDSTKLSSLCGNNKEQQQSVDEILHRCISNSNVPMLLLLNKRDSPLSKEMNPQMVSDYLKLDQLEGDFCIQPCCTLTGEGLQQGFDWIVEQLNTTKKLLKAPTVTFGTEEPLIFAHKLLDWQLGSSSIPSDKEFLRDIIERYNESRISLATTLPWTLDHLTFMRLIWILLTKFGRREALPVIFHLAKASMLPTAYNETITYFWINTVHFAIEELQSANNQKNATFISVLYSAPRLLNENFIETFYTAQLLHTDKCRDHVVLPDKRPLPTIIRFDSVQTQPPSDEALRERLNVAVPSLMKISDHTFYELATTGRLPAWGHRVKLRLIYVLLILRGRQRGGVDQILSALKGIEKSGYNVTVCYFWIQMVTFHMMLLLRSQDNSRTLDRSAFGHLFNTSNVVNEDDSSILQSSMSFDEFFRYSDCEDLLDPQMMENYYSKDELLNLDDQYVTLPSIKPLPNIMVN